MAHPWLTSQPCALAASVFQTQIVSLGCDATLLCVPESKAEVDTVEIDESLTEVLLACLEAVLNDVPRLGMPETFSAKQLTRIISGTREAPEASGHPMTIGHHESEPRK